MEYTGKNRFHLFYMRHSGGRDKYSKKRLNGVDDHMLYSHEKGFVRRKKNRFYMEMADQASSKPSRLASLDLLLQMAKLLSFPEAPKVREVWST